MLNSKNLKFYTAKLTWPRLLVSSRSIWNGDGNQTEHVSLDQLPNNVRLCEKNLVVAGKFLVLTF